MDDLGRMVADTPLLEGWGGDDVGLGSAEVLAIGGYRLGPSSPDGMSCTRSAVRSERRTDPTHFDRVAPARAMAARFALLGASISASLAPLTSATTREARAENSSECFGVAPLAFRSLTQSASWALSGLASWSR
jgi:hypothetical protein